MGAGSDRSAALALGAEPGWRGAIPFGRKPGTEADLKRGIWRGLLIGFVAAGLGALATFIAMNLAAERPRVSGPLEHRFTASDPQFERTMAGLFGAPILGGHRIDILVDGAEIYGAMLEGIAAATETVHFENYVYWAGEVGRRFAEAFAERAAAGVEVRVLLDWVGSLPMDDAFIERMTSAGVRFERFRPLRWYTVDRINNRTHRKLLIIDGRVGFTGGAGIGDEWLASPTSPEEWRENHYRIEGPIVAGMQAAFADNWMEATGELLRGDPYFPALRSAGPLRAQQLMTAPRAGADGFHLQLLTALSAAGSNIRIGMAYFVPDDAVIAQLIEARQRGVGVEVVMPGPLVDYRFVRRASRRFWGDLLQAGVRLYEYQPAMFHPKYVVVDEEWTSIGSANVHERSFGLNDEYNINVYDQAFARAHIDLFEADRARSLEVTYEQWRDRPLSTRLHDWAWSLLRPQF